MTSLSLSKSRYLTAADPKINQMKSVVVIFSGFCAVVSLAKALDPDLTSNKQPLAIGSEIDPKLAGSKLEKVISYSPDGKIEQMQSSFASTTPMGSPGGNDIVLAGRLPSGASTQTLYQARLCNEGPIQDPTSPQVIAPAGDGCTLNQLARLGSVETPVHVRVNQQESLSKSIRNEDRATKRSMAAQQSAEKGLGIQIGPFSMALKSEESSESTSDSSASSTSMVQEYVAEAYTVGLDGSHVGVLCLRADVGQALEGQDGKVLGILPASATPETMDADNKEEWKTVGCLNPISSAAVSPDTVDKIKELAQVVDKHLPEGFVKGVVEAAKTGTKPFSAGGMEAVLKLLPPIMRKAAQNAVEGLGVNVVTEALLGGKARLAMDVVSEELSSEDVQQSMSSFSAQVDPASMAGDLEGIVDETNVETVTTVEGKTTTVQTTTVEHSTNTTTADSASKNQQAQAIASSGLSFGGSASKTKSSSASASSTSNSADIKVTGEGGDVAALRETAHGGELSQSDLEAWAASVPGAASVLKQQVVELAQVLLVGDLDACVEVQADKYRGVLDADSPEAEELFSLLTACLGSASAATPTDPKNTAIVAYAMQSLIFEAAQTVMANAGPIANIRQATLHLINAAKEGLVETEDDCKAVNAYILLLNKAAAKYPAVTSTLPLLDCETVIGASYDRIGTGLTTDQTAMLTYQPRKGHLGDMCAQCLNWMTRAALDDKDPNKGRPWSYRCDDRLQPKADPAGCEGLRETIEKVGGGQGDQQRVFMTCARSPAEQLVADYLISALDHPTEAQIGIQKTDLKIPAVYCTLAGACGVDETGMKRSIRRPKLGSRGQLDPVGSGNHLGGSACNGRDLVVVDQTAGSATEGNHVVVPSDQVSMTLPASVVFTVASRRRGTCPGFEGLSAYSKEFSSRGVFGDHGPVIQNAHVVLDFAREHGQYVVQENPVASQTQAMTYSPQSMPPHEGRLSVVADKAVVTTIPLTCRKDPSGRKYPRLRGINVGDKGASVWFETGYAHTSGEKHVLSGTKYGKGAGTDLTCVRLVLDKPSVKRLKTALFPRESDLQKATKAVEDKLEAATKKGLDAAAVDKALAQLQTAEAELADLQRGMRLLGGPSEVLRKGSQHLECR